MKTISKKILTAAALAICAFPLAAQTENAKTDEARKKLAEQLVQIQQKTDAPQITQQMVAAVAQPVIATWSQNIDASVPADKQNDVREKLDGELKKLIESLGNTIETQALKTAESALVPVYMEKLSAEDMKTIIAYMKSPASAKFQEVGGDAARAWASKIMDATEKTASSHIAKFDEAAAKIVKAATEKTGAKPAPAAKAENKAEAKTEAASESTTGSGIKTRVERIEPKP